MLVPDVDLRTWVTDVAVETVPPSGTQASPPDPATTLVFCSAAEEAFVVGPQTRGKYFRGAEAHRLKVRLRPGRARAVLGVAAHELVDRVVPLRDLWGSAVAPGELRRVLAERLAAVDPQRDALVTEAVRTVPSSGVAATARALHVSERHLRTLFNDAVGLSPKQFTRVERVRRVVASGKPGSWARLATELGYYDQSHLSAEFRATMGVAPGAFAAGRFPEAQPC
ncbi:AraC-like DNA-binding protein [Saccharothrix tamanrassetensis]|uniref:AraC-like DNA-binding protein n=1 Tax=Saccharothrix tamanrassetensis TaxID=1051531 RepID=A0A841CRH0_9PSEU|nr:helix-turn-helix domain-containing protein [Saccharothrix tamanrassetensis]MBB5960331.1 AraC-like DNA-binding protein [Saccharothrix tamanrassetensis]